MKAMTSRERLLTVIRGGIPDRVPATVHQWQAYHYTKVMGVANDLDAFVATGLDAVVYPWACVKQPESPSWKVRTVSRPRSEGMTEYETDIETPGGNLTTKGVGTDYTYTTTEPIVKQPGDIHLLDRYMPVPTLDVDAVRALAGRLGDHGIMRGFTNGPQGSPWQDACCYCGTEEMIYHAHDNPAWTHEFLEILLRKKVAFYERNLAPLAGVFAMIETGGGAASNTVISPAMFKEFCIPYDVRQHDVIRGIDPGIAVSYHTCGGMMRLLDLIPLNGCQFSETLSPTGCGGDIRDRVDEAAVKQVLGSRVKLMGGLNQMQALTDGGKADIFAEVERCFRGYGAGGGYIMMPSDHFFHAPAENLAHYAAAAREIGGYR